MKIGLSTVLVGMVVSGTAFGDAINRFSWNAFSTDDKMYVCNAGIRHVNGTAGHVSSTSGGANSGTTGSTHDYMSVVSRGLDMDMLSGPAKTSSVEANGGSSFAQVVRDSDSFGNLIDSLNFNLTSENYGVEYFVDVCYRGPMIDFNANRIASNFILAQNKLTYNDLRMNSGQSYFTLASLQVSSHTVCDTQLTGSARGAPTNLLAADIKNMVAPRGDVVVAPSRVRLSRRTQEINFNGSKKPVLNASASKVYNAPRFCKTRYLVKETAVTERNWNVVGGKFTALTEIENR